MRRPIHASSRDRKLIMERSRELPLARPVRFAALRLRPLCRLGSIKPVGDGSPYAAHTNEKLADLSIARLCCPYGTFSRLSSAVAAVVGHRRLRM